MEAAVTSYFLNADNELGADGYTIEIKLESADCLRRVNFLGTNITDETYSLPGVSILDPRGFNQTLFARWAK